jgi:hypothetical protein
MRSLVQFCSHRIRLFFLSCTENEPKTVGGKSVERVRQDAKLRYVVTHGAACSYCLARAERLEGSYLRTFALELKERLAQTITAFVMSILTQPRWRLDAEDAAEPPLRQIIDVLQQVMCAHDAEKLAISVLEIYEDGYHEERISK